MKILKNIASFLALFIGVMSIFAGTRVLMGIDIKEYNVMPMLVIYNVVIGAIAIITAFLIFKEKPLAKKMSYLILALHFIVLLAISFLIKETAFESKMAMIFRTVIWLIIIVFLQIIPKMAQARK